MIMACGNIVYYFQIRFGPISEFQKGKPSLP